MKRKTNSLPILEKVFNGSKNDASQKIADIYKKQGYAIVSFLYFANAMKHRLFEHTDNKKSLNYKDAMLASDFILPDGIALELFYYVASWFSKKLVKQKPKNLNGTDFIPYFLKRLIKQTKDIHMGIFTTYDPVINKTLKEIERAKSNFKVTYGIDIVYTYAQNYRDLNKNKAFKFDEYETSLKKANSKWNILLMCTGTPTQELRVEQNRSFIEKNKILVFNAGGFVDFLSGFETRAPKRVVKAKVLETFRRIINNPQKNLKKFLVMFGIVRFLLKKLASTLSKIALKK